ncbi:MAG: ABC transporter substrate-binding protein [Alphaproteobacteria bacterium]|nr:ABC transporter substrate-binding protein [Alphaproteobacteria bacterium]
MRGWVPIVTLAALLLSMPAGAAGPPQRIVSLNVCADQLLLGLVPRGRIVALSKFAADPTLSPVAEVARSMKRASGRVDEVLALEPDFVVAGTSSTRLSVDLLRRLGTPVFELATAEELSTIRSETMRLARALDAEEAGRAMIAAFDARLAGLERPATQASPRAAIFLESGMTLGPETLSGRVLALAGYRNAVQELGIQGFGHLSLEALVRLDPDLVVVGGTLDGGPALASSLLSHPALAELRAKARFVPEPRAQWVCGGPAVADALARLVPEGAS